MTSADTLRHIITELEPIAGSCARFEAELMLEKLCGVTRHGLYTRTDIAFDTNQKACLRSWIEKRKSHVPLAHILHQWHFYSCTLTVTPDVLIPRAETECLVATILSHHPATAHIYFCDVGTGSGNITAALLHERPCWRAVSTDNSPDALRCARSNIKKFAAELICCDMLHGLHPVNQFDLIVSNPPYIPQPQLTELDSSVIDHEPVNALDGGKDGLTFYRYFAARAYRYLRPGAALYMEIGSDQADDIARIFSRPPWIDFNIFSDMNCRARIAYIKKRLL